MHGGRLSMHGGRLSMHGGRLTFSTAHIIKLNMQRTGKVVCMGYYGIRL